MSYIFLQNYWWFLISLLGGLLVFLMFVQGGNALLSIKGLSDNQKRMIVNSTGRKWELAFTTLVTFGAGFFASFPLFYSTSFGGAYWVWIILLITFVFQAVSYEFQNKKHNILGSRAFRIFLVINGILAPLIVGAAVGTFFTGSDFIVNKNAILGDGHSSIISTWGNSWHGLEALTQPICLSLGLSILFLDVLLGALYIVNNVNDADLDRRMRCTIKIISIFFLVAVLTFLALILTKEGFAVAEDGTVSMEKFKYLHNLLQMPIVLIMLLAGVVAVLSGLYMGAFTKSRYGIWPAGFGTVLVVLAVFFIAGYNGTAYYPSYTDLQSSLTIRNSSSSEFTLKSMFFVSLAIPFVLAYIVYAWHQMDKKKISEEEIKDNGIKY
jgi:hypothetical protein